MDDGKFNRSDYLDRLYALDKQDREDEAHDHAIHSHHHHDEDECCKPMSDADRNKLKINVLNGVAKHMCLKSIPCDKETDYELEADVAEVVDRYFSTRSGKLLQYFSDTKNTVTDIIQEAIDTALRDHPVVSPDDEQFVTAVVDQVTNDEDVEEVVKTIERDIKKSAEADIQEIIDTVKDDDPDDSDANSAATNPQGAMIPTFPPTNDGIQLGESVFHHYLIKCYKEFAVPDDPEIMLVKPMVETAMHYVRRVLFSDGFSRKGDD